eukprot:1156395-Pelagomonas_calceolata.AAC.10
MEMRARGKHHAQQAASRGLYRGLLSYRDVMHLPSFPWVTLHYDVSFEIKMRPPCLNVALMPQEASNATCQASLNDA